MPKGEKKKGGREFKELSPLAQRLLIEMAKNPTRLEYNTMVLGGIFKDADVERLDDAYRELATHGFAEKSDSSVAFIGEQKHLYRITEAGKEAAKRGEVA